MERAIEEAMRSATSGNYALGAAVVSAAGKVVALGHTTLHEVNDPTAHAEVNAIRTACAKVGSRYLPGCWLYTTLEPCPMCSAAAVWAKMAGIVYGANQDDAVAAAALRAGESFTWRQISLRAVEVLQHGEPRLALHENFMRDECLKLLQQA